MEKLLLITPPFVQVNCPYPATAYLKGYLTRKGFDVEQKDLSIELINKIFSRNFLEKVFDLYKGSNDENLERIYALRTKYTETVDTIIRFLQNGDSTIANLICGADFLPQASRFETIQDLDYFFGTLGNADCAKYLATLYLQDLSDFIRATVSSHFEIVRYAEKISLSVKSFSQLEGELSTPRNLIEEEMTALMQAYIDEYGPTMIAFNVPFPGNLLATLRCAQYIKEKHPQIKTLMGGGYPTTELRNMTDKGIFKYIDYIILDDGELPLERTLSGNKLLNTYTAEGFFNGMDDNNEIGLNQKTNTKHTHSHITHIERGCPDFSGLPHNKYLSLTEVTNPMHRLWSDGRWNKMMIAHGCYWAKCAFCDTSLEYICRYDSMSASQFVDYMEDVMQQTGSSGFHFVDEAAPPKMLKEISLEILRRKLKVSWWTNIRFEASYTGDLCSLMASAGCIAVSGGLEVASDRILKLMNKGVDIEQATIAMRNFYYAGIMVHTYLMYGFPTETLQESVDSLEIVRQMFRAELISSAFWHRFARTVHSSVGIDPERFGIKAKNQIPNGFANNEIPFNENRNYNLNMVGEALNDALANYMYGNAINRPVHKWFRGKDIPETTIENSLITDHLIKPDASRIYNDSARLVWIGVQPVRNENGLTFHSNSDSKHIRFTPSESDFLIKITALCSNLERKTLFSEIKQIYSEYSNEPFAVFYHSKKWDILRKYGLLQI